MAGIRSHRKGWALKKKLNNRWHMPSDVVDVLIAHVTGKSSADADAIIERTVANAALRAWRNDRYLGRRRKTGCGDGLCIVTLP